VTAPVALVTGASRGIGRRLCRDLAGAGYDVVCAARSSQERPGKLPGTVDDSAAEVRERGRRALPVALDVRDEEAVAALAARVYREWGRCDLLINNAAVAPAQPALQDSTRRWRLAVEVNLNGPFYLMHALCPRMAAAGGGRVVNVSSGASRTPEFGRAS
jgi:NAD(P)-dependent dehydrogenase (short-subunit alcohol dehydrogenase family)